MRKSTLLAMALVTCAWAAQVPAATLHVYNGESIQQAIESAGSGDTVLVHNGSYTSDPSDNNRIHMLGKSITLRSENGPDSTTIHDAEIVFDNADTRSSRLEGIKLTQYGGPSWEYLVRFDSSAGTVVNCRFQDSRSSGVGALNGSTPLIQNCEFIRTGMYDWFGGGVYSYFDSDVDVENCYFEACIAWGGALYAEWNASITADYCTFVRCGDKEPGSSDPMTKSGAAGTAGVNWDGRIDMNHCTVFGSYATSGGAAIHATDGIINLDRCIVAFCRLPPSGETFFCFPDGTINLSCCDVYGNAAGDYTNCVAGQGGSANNFSLDPAFCDTSINDLGLQEGSPCIAHGSCGQVGSLGQACTGGTPLCWHVSPGGDNSTGDGTQGNPWRTLQHAIDQASSGDCITAHPGTYSGPGNRLIDYHGKRVTLQSEWGPDSTLIDCDTTRGFIFDNHEDTNFVLRGFTIREGSEEAVWCDNAGSPLIEDCVFLENIRGITCRDSASPVIRRCVFRNNYYPDDYNQGGLGVGAAIACHVAIDSGGVIDTTRRSNPTIDSCVFEGNRASRAAIYCYHSSPVITRSLFLRNGFPDTTGVAVCVFVSDGPGPTISQCTFYGNLASTGSAVGVQLNGTITLDRCIMARNIVRLSTGRVVFCDHAGTVNLTCSNVYDNLHGDYLGCIAGLEV